MSTFKDGGNLLKQYPVGLFNFSVPLYANEGLRHAILCLPSSSYMAFLCLFLLRRLSPSIDPEL